MSSTVKQVLILPGSAVNFYCKDGLSALDLLNIQKVFHFGGKIEFVDCGGENWYVGLEQSYQDMFSKWMLTAGTHQ